MDTKSMIQAMMGMIFPQFMIGLKLILLQVGMGQTLIYQTVEMVIGAAMDRLPM